MNGRKSPTAGTATERIRAMLRNADYRFCWETTPNPGNNFTLLCYVGHQGVLLLQSWPNGDCEIYQTEGIPKEWDKLAAWLTE